jgi:serine/threonine-protein kinase
VDDPLVGRTLGDRYRVTEKIAAGGMGVVYRGERIQLGRPVAIKFLRALVAADQSAIKRFEIEAKATSRLSHPNCVAILDFGVDDGVPYLVLDFVVGRPLRSMLDLGPMPASRAIQVTRQVLAGLSHAHGQGIIHRDIKPDNILLGEVTGVGLQVRILDFGMAKLLDAGGTSLTQGFAVGTPSYMSPEQTLSEPVDARSDLYSTGVLLFEMISGEKPFRAEELRDLLQLHRTAPAPRLRALVPKISSALEEVVAKAMAKAPADRWQTAGEMLRALDATPEGKSSKTVAGALPPPDGTVILSAADLTPVAPSRARWPLLLLLPVLALAAGGAWWLLRAAPAEEEAPQVPVVEPTPPAAPPPADTPSEIAEALRQAEGGPWASSVKRLEQLRKRYPDNAVIPYTLGHLYMEKLWGQEAFAAYQDAIERNPAYRTDPQLIRDAVRSLLSDSHAWRGLNFLRKEIGAAAVPYLEEVKDSKATRLRTHARRLLDELGQ